MEKFDFIIVGGGLNGMWLAYHLTQKGQKVCVVDKQDFTKKPFWNKSKAPVKLQRESLSGQEVYVQESAGIGSWQRFSCNVGSKMHSQLPEMTEESMRFYKLSEKAVKEGFAPFYIPKPSLVVANASEENNIVQQYKENCAALKRRNINIDYQILCENEMTKQGLSESYAKGMIGFLESEETAGTIDIDSCLTYLKHKVEYSGTGSKVVLGQELHERDITQINNGNDGYQLRIGDRVFHGKKMAYVTGAKGIKEAMQKKGLPYFLQPETLKRIFSIQRVPVFIVENSRILMDGYDGAGGFISYGLRNSKEPPPTPFNFPANIGFATKEGKGLIDVVFPLDNADGEQRLFFARYTGLQPNDWTKSNAFLNYYKHSPVDQIFLWERLRTFHGIFPNAPHHYNENSPYQEALYFISLTSSGLPLCDESKSHPNLYFFNGCHGSWAKTAPVFAKVAAEMMTGQTPSYNTEPFSLENMLNHALERQEPLPGEKREKAVSSISYPHAFDTDSIGRCTAMIAELCPQKASKIIEGLSNFINADRNIAHYLEHGIHGELSTSIRNLYDGYVKNMENHVLSGNYRGEYVPTLAYQYLSAERNEAQMTDFSRKFTSWQKDWATKGNIANQIKQITEYLVDAFIEMEGAKPQKEKIIHKQKIAPAFEVMGRVQGDLLGKLCRAPYNKWVDEDSAVRLAVGGTLYQMVIDGMNEALEKRLEQFSGKGAPSKSTRSR